MLRLAIQKSGRLSDDSLDLIKACDIRINTSRNKLRTPAANFPLEVLFLRDDDIPGYVADGVADMGIVGENVVAEQQAPVETTERLGFGRCRLSIALPKSEDYHSPQDLAGRDLATSYPHLLGQFLQRHGVTANIHEISGSVEIAPSIGLADGICDLVSTGSTLLSNGLAEVETILHSEALLIRHVPLPDEKQQLLRQLLTRIRAVQRAKRYKYILLNAPNDAIAEITRLLPGMKSPTVMPLAEAGWSSLHSVVQEDNFWEIIAQLEALGAQGILVIPIEKMLL